MWELDYKAECQRIDDFELWCWRRLFGVPWTARRSNQSILKEIRPEYSLEGLMLKLKLQYFGHLIPRTDSLEKRPWCWERLRAEGEGDDRGWGGWIASPTQWTWVWVNSRSWWWTGRFGMLQFMGSQRVGHDWATELNWTGVPGKPYSISQWSEIYSFVSNILPPMDCVVHGFLNASLLKFMPIESVMLSNNLILCHSLLLPPSIFPSIRVFSKESALHIRWPK